MILHGSRWSKSWIDAHSRYRKNQFRERIINDNNSAGADRFSPLSPGMRTTQTWMGATEFRRKYRVFRRALLPWTIFYLMLSIAWGVGVFFLRNSLSSTLARRIVFLFLAAGTLLPLIVGAIHTWRLQARHGLRCPVCGYGLGGGAGKLAMLNGKCPDCREQILEAGM